MNQFNALKVNFKTFSESILYLLLEMNNQSECDESVKHVNYSQIIEEIITTEFDEY